MQAWTVFWITHGIGKNLLSSTDFKTKEEADRFTIHMKKTWKFGRTNFRLWSNVSNCFVSA